MYISVSSQSPAQQSLWKSFLFHIIPGILTTLGFLVFKPVLDFGGYPPLLAFLLSIILIDIPFMLGVMLKEGKKLNGHYSLAGVVQYHEKVSWKTFGFVFVAVFIVLYLLIMLSSPLNSFVAKTAFDWLPDWFFFENAAQYAGYAKDILVLVFSLQLLITGIILPWVEELYFRGYLMPRISRFEQWTPLLGGLFFGMYHVWQLFGLVGVFLLGAGLGYVVWWKREIRLSISLHVFANSVIRVFLLLGVLAM